jgi:hypothetical protein
MLAFTNRSVTSYQKESKTKHFISSESIINQGKVEISHRETKQKQLKEKHNINSRLCNLQRFFTMIEIAKICKK